jgi:hypothetical protein
MRRSVFALCGFLASVLVAPGTAQVNLLPNSPPAVTAASAEWQIRGEPVFYAGSFYDPIGPTVFFDGFVMERVGQYRGVPLYEDATLPPYDRVYVPIGRNVMRPYARRPTREAAVVEETPVVPESVPSDVGTSATVVPEVTSSLGTVAERGPTVVESIPPPRGNRGIWIEFGGARWYSAGRAVPLELGRFVRIGDHEGFPVFQSREEGRRPARIYVEMVTGGPLAPYVRESGRR